VSFKKRPVERQRYAPDLTQEKEDAKNTDGHDQKEELGCAP